MRQRKLVLQPNSPLEQILCFEIRSFLERGDAFVVKLLCFRRWWRQRRTREFVYEPNDYPKNEDCCGDISNGQPRSFEDVRQRGDGAGWLRAGRGRNQTGNSAIRAAAY